LAPLIFARSTICALHCDLHSYFCNQSRDAIIGD